MGMNIRGHVDTRRYNPSRDIAYAWPNLMKGALTAFDKEVDEPVTACLIRTFNIDDHSIGELVARYAKYFQACLEQGDKDFKTPEQALASTGFFDLPPSHQAVILSRLGQIITGAFFYAIREVHVDDDKPFNDAAVIEAGFKAKQAFLNRRKPWYFYVLKPWLLFHKA